MGAPMWIVTFTDMISLLLTFFIMILTFSSMEEEKFQQATGSLSGAFGVITNLRMRSKPDVTETAHAIFRDQDRDGPSDPSIRDDVVKRKIKQVQDRDLFNVHLEARDVVEGTRIEVKPENNRELFDLGTDRPTRHTNRVLVEIAKMFATLPVRLVVETHVDDRIWKARYESADDLSRLMALSAAQILEDSGIAAERVGIAPKGSRFPVTTNDKADGRYANRRLVILVIPHSKDEAYRGARGR